MGTYVYRVTAKTVICPDGEKANIYKFAYKPYSDWSGENRQLNSRMHFQSGALSSDNMAKAGKLSSRIVFQDDEGKIYWDNVRSNKQGLGTFYDYMLDNDQYFGQVFGV